VNQLKITIKKTQLPSRDREPRAKKYRICENPERKPENILSAAVSQIISKLALQKKIDRLMKGIMHCAWILK
jgi:hypothetical protein